MKPETISEQMLLLCLHHGELDETTHCFEAEGNQVEEEMDWGHANGQIDPDEIDHEGNTTEESDTLPTQHAIQPQMST